MFAYKWQPTCQTPSKVIFWIKHSWIACSSNFSLRDLTNLRYLWLRRNRLKELPTELGLELYHVFVSFETPQGYFEPLISAVYRSQFGRGASWVKFHWDDLWCNFDYAASETTLWTGQTFLISERLFSLVLFGQRFELEALKWNLIYPGHVHELPCMLAKSLIVLLDIWPSSQKLTNNSIKELPDAIYKCSKLSILDLKEVVWLVLYE